MVKIAIALFLIIVIIVIVADSYKYPMCPRCGHNRFSVRIKGRIICSVHGDVTENQNETKD